MKKYFLLMFIFLNPFLFHKISIAVENENIRTQIVAHKMNYFLFLTKDLIDIADTERQNQEAKFQLSLKFPLFEDSKKKININDSHKFYFAYTQKSWWQVYDEINSRPFRENNYNPEVYYDFKFSENIQVNIGFEHESNGRGSEKVTQRKENSQDDSAKNFAPNSRSWNRLYSIIKFSTAFKNGQTFDIQLKNWMVSCEFSKHRCDNKIHDENPRINYYYGKGELTLNYSKDIFLFNAMLRNNFEAYKDNKGALEFNLIFPISCLGIDMQLQYWTGYGESLIDYNRQLVKYGLGFTFSHKDILSKKEN